MLVDGQKLDETAWSRRWLGIKIGCSMKVWLQDEAASEEGIGHSYKQRTYSTFSSYTLPYLLLLGDGEGRKGRGRL